MRNWNRRQAPPTEFRSEWDDDRWDEPPYRGPYAYGGYGDEGWDRPRNLGGRDYETRHFGMGRGGFSRPPNLDLDHGRSMSGMQGSFGLGQRGEVPGWGRGMGGSDLGMGQRLDTDRGPFYGKGPKGYRRSDDRIREEICECISMQGHIDATDVEITVENGIVTMKGTVPQRHDKRMLERMVDHVRGVDDVHNELRVKREQREPREQARTSSSDVQARPSQRPPNGKNTHS
jgi:hypothetical protein